MSLYFAYLYSIVIIIGLEISLLKPSFFAGASAVIVLFNIFFVWAANRFKFNLNFFNFLISPLLFLLSGFLFLLFSNSFLLKELVIFFLVVANTIFLRRLIIHNYFKHQYHRHSLSNISRVINVSSIFFFATGFYDLYSFLRIPMSLLSVLNILVVALTIYQFFCINKIYSNHFSQIPGNIDKLKLDTSTNRYFIIVSSIVLWEIFFIIHWLPLLPYAKGILVVSAYYFIASLSKHHVLGTLARPVYIRYSLVTAIIWIATLATSRWT